MPQQDENLEGSQPPEEELDVTEQLDLLLEELRAIEPDLLQGSVVAEPAVADAPPADEPAETDAPQADESAEQEVSEPVPIVAEEELLSSDEAVESADTPVEAEPSEAVAAADAQPPEEAEPVSDLGAALDDILAMAELEEEVSGEEVQPSVSEEPVEEAVAEEVAEPAQEEASGGGDLDLADQLQALLSSSEIAETAEETPQSGPASEEVVAEPVAAESSDDVAADSENETPVEQLSLEQIDQLLAEEAVDPEADSELADLLEVPAETIAQVEVAAAEVVEEEDSADQPEEIAEVTASASEGGGGFDANAASVAKELDDQPELKPTMTASAVSEAKDGGRTRPIRFKLDKQLIVTSVWACERLLRRTCTAMNSPLRRLPPAIRDAVGVAAFFHLLVGSVLIFGKLVGAI